MKTLLIVGGVAAVAYGGAKFYVQHKVGSELDRMTSMAAPFAKISYSTISSDLLDGSIQIDKVAVAPLEASDAVTIERLYLRGDGPGFLFDLISGGPNQQPPERLQLTFSNLSLPLGLASQAGSSFGAGAIKPPEPCSLAGVLQHTGLDRLGYDRLTVNGSMRYRLPPGGEGLSLQMEYGVDGVEWASMDVELSGPVSPAAMAFGGMPGLDRLEMTYQMSGSYSKAILEYCGQQAGQPPAEFAQSLFAVDDAVYAKQLGFVPGAGLRTALQQLLMEEAELTLTANPGPGLDMSTLGLYQPQQLVEVLGVELAVNNQPVQDMSYQLPAESRNLLSQLASGGSGKTEERKPVKVDRYVKRYLATPLADIKQHIGRDVRIYTDAEKPREGILVAVKDNIISVEQRMHGGKAILHTATRNVNKFEVLTSIKVDR